MENEFLTMKEIGSLYGKSSHQVGRVLKEQEYRTENGKPSAKAFREGMVAQRFAAGYTGIYLWAWHRVKTSAILEASGWQQVTDEY